MPKNEKNLVINTLLQSIFARFRMGEAAFGRSPFPSTHKCMKGSLAPAVVRPGQCQPFGAVPAVRSQARYLTFLNPICKSGLIIFVSQIIVGITWNLTMCVNTWHYLAWRRCSGNTSLVRKRNVATAQECQKMLFETQILFSNLFSCWFPVNNRDALITEYQGPQTELGHPSSSLAIWLMLLPFAMVVSKKTGPLRSLEFCLYFK